VKHADPRADIDAVKRALADPREVCRRLGLDQQAKPQGGGGLTILCPAHGDRSPSCSVTRGPDGTLRVRCFACGFAGDVLDLLAAVERLDRNRDFPELLRRAAELAHVQLEREASRPMAPAKKKPSAEAIAPPAPAPRRPFPPAEEIGAFWAMCQPVSEDPEVVRWLEGRGLSPAAIGRYDVARALPRNAHPPPWASYRGDRPSAEPWTALGYRLILSLHDEAGVIRSVRARAVATTDGPKALPPSGYAAKGLVMADPLAAMMLALGSWPEHAEKRVVISEGEPDFLTWASRGTGARTLAVLGIAGAGTWTKEIADRIPDGSTAIVRTDQDDAGDRYAEQITASLWGRCAVLESDPEARRARRATRPEREREARKPGASARKSRR
jgi:DNA primase